MGRLTPMPKPVTKTVASYTVKFVYGDGAYNVSVPALPECLTWGKTLRQAEARAREAIQCCVETRQKEGNRTGDTVMIPFHSGYIPRPTLKGILRQAGISEKDFHALLRGKKAA